MKKAILATIVGLTFSSAAFSKVDMNHDAGFGKPHPENVYIAKNGSTVVLHKQGVVQVVDGEGNSTFHVAEKSQSFRDIDGKVVHINGAGHHYADIKTGLDKFLAEAQNGSNNGQGGDVGRPITGRPDQGLPDVDNKPDQDLPEYGNNDNRPFPGTGVAPSRPQPGNGIGSVERPQPGQDNRPGAGSGVEKPFPGQGERPTPGTGNGSVERPQPGNGVGSVERPQPGQGNRPQPGTGNGSVERPQPGNGVGSVERPRPGQGEGSVSRPQPGENNRPGAGSGTNKPSPGNGSAVERPQPPAFIGQINTNANNIASMGQAFEQRVDMVNGYLSQAGEAIQNNGNKIDALGAAFQAQAAHTASEITRLDGRIDSLEKKTDKLKAGVAGATAIASLTQYVGNGTHHVAVGIGGYDGASALAGGYTYAISANTTIRATIALDSEDEVAFGASVGHSW